MRQEVSVVDIKMPFGSMMVFMIKWAIASIPALIVLSVLGGIIMMMFATIVGVGGALGGALGS